MKTTPSIKRWLMSGVSIPLLSFAVQAQDASSADDEIEEIQVIGSQIKGAKVAGTLPVTVIGTEDINLTGAIDGDELFRSIPQTGFVAFNENNTVGGINGARGDVSSINLRALGTGNTLTLVNGRRMVLHPGFQTENLVPVVSANTNTIPTFGVRRVEVLRDGAAAIYGADAVAGVINTVLQDDYEGLSVQGRFGFADNTGRQDITINAKAGFEFNGGATHISLFGGFLNRNRTAATERAFSASSDRRFFPELIGTAFEGDSQFNNLSISSPFGRFRADIRIDEIGDDDFHVQPNSGDFASTCLVDRGDGVCFDNGTALEDPLRYDFDVRRNLHSPRDRYNFFGILTHEFEGGSEFYAEASYYRADLEQQNSNGSVLSSQRFEIAADAFYNPFGAANLPDGSPNPNRIAGLSNVPDEGVTIQVRNLRPVDAGPQITSVTDDSFRVLGGFRGNWGAWDYDTALLYSEASTTDATRNRISLSLFQQAINRTDASAYNPFAGGSFTDLFGTIVGNSESTIDSFRINVTRKNKATLFLTDFKLSNASVFSLPAGDVGFATGVEARREGFSDDRDDRLDGTITFTDEVTGNFVTGSDVLGSSPTPDTSGSRWVVSAFAEFAVPLVSPDMDIPLVQSLDFQVAGRYEDFEISGSTFKPKIAGSWVVTDGLMFRGAWSEGFRAPNLVQIFDTGIRRVNTRDDLVICQAEVDAGVIASLDDCNGDGVESVRSGTGDLENEDTTQYNIGVVLEPAFIPGLTLTADYWRVEQRGIVGIFGDNNQIALDLLLRSQGSSNPNVVRGAVDDDLSALFAQSSLAAAGEIVEVRDPYTNLDNREVEGLDFGLLYQLDTDALGSFNFAFNAAKLSTFEQTPGALGQQLLNAIATGQLPDSVEVTGVGDLVEQNGRPEWRFTSSVRWRNENWGAGLFGRYVGAFDDTSVTNNTTGEAFRVDDWFTVNANVSYEFEEGSLEGTRIQIGINNLFDEDPPLSDESFGFFGDVHSGVGRFFFIDVQKTF